MSLTKIVSYAAIRAVLMVCILLITLTIVLFNHILILRQEVIHFDD